MSDSDNTMNQNLYVQRIKDILHRSKYDFSRTRNLHHKITYRLIKKAADLVLDETKSKTTILKDLETYLRVLVQTGEKHRLAKKLTTDFTAGVKCEASKVAFSKLLEVYEHMVQEIDPTRNVISIDGDDSD